MNGFKVFHLCVILAALAFLFWTIQNDAHIGDFYLNIALAYRSERKRCMPFLEILKMINPHYLVVSFLIVMGILLTIWNTKLQLRNHDLTDKCNELARKKHKAEMALKRYEQDVVGKIEDFCESPKKNHGATA